MGVGVVLAAAGTGRRMGGAGNKILLPLQGKPIFLHSLEVFAALKEVQEIVIVTRDVDQKFVEDATLGLNCKIIAGGRTRQESVYYGLKALGKDINWVAVHDAARPYITEDTIRFALQACYREEAVGVAVPVTDTIKVVEGGRICKTLPREKLWTMQTPQIFSRPLIVKAHKEAKRLGIEATDDCALVERMGHPVYVVQGEYGNIKITTPEDLPQEKGLFVGFGWDVHRLGTNRPLILGGVEVPYDKGLLGHSDADVVCHAVMDAILGAAGLGDIGELFPDTDLEYKGISSLVLLRRVMGLLQKKQAIINNIDITIMAEKPNMAPVKGQMKETLAEALGILKNRVNIKATTTEGLGFVGKGEGIAAQAVVSLSVDL